MIAPPLETSVIVLAHPLESALRVIPLADEMVIGRRQSVGIRLFDGHCAGRHARLERTPSGAIVRDMGSTNTTLVNGNEIRFGHGGGHDLRVGDQIQAGYSLFRFEHTLAGTPWPSEARALLDEIVESPDNDDPRLVFADWLGDRGDPRGEFICCQLAKDSVSRARAEELLAEHELAWVAPLPIPVESWTFARGFVSSIRMRDLAAGELLRQHHPLAIIEPIPWDRITWGSGIETREPVEPPQG